VVSQCGKSGASIVEKRLVLKTEVSSGVYLHYKFRLWEGFSLYLHFVIETIIRGGGVLSGTAAHMAARKIVEAIEK